VITSPVSKRNEVINYESALGIRRNEILVSVVVLKCILRANYAANTSQYLYVDPKWIQVLCVWDSIAWRSGTSLVLPSEVRNIRD
jgi:hypothetical protein